MLNSPIAMEKVNYFWFALYINIHVSINIYVIAASSSDQLPLENFETSEMPAIKH